MIGAIVAIIKDKVFWKHVFVFEIIGMSLLFFVVSPLVSVYDYKNKGDTIFTKLNMFGGYYDPNNDRVVLMKNSTVILRHELTHREQAERNETNIYYMEFEAYVKQWFIWNKVNLTSMDWEK